MTSPELRIVPAPSERDGKAIAAAFARASGAGSGAGGRTAWWRAGVRESVAPPAPGRRR